MPKPTEHKTVQLRILKYADEIGWDFVPKEEAERRRGFKSEGTGKEKALGASFFFEDILYEKVKKFNAEYKEPRGSLTGLFRHIQTNINGNREFLKYLRNQGTFFSEDENRELNLKLIDYKDIKNNHFEVTEEFWINNGRHANREDIVFLINGIPVVVVECKNADRDEAIAIGIDQLKRYHQETPEVMVPEMVFTATEAIGFAYGVTWNLVRRNIFIWKHDDPGNLEAKVKTFFSIPYILKLIENYIVFAEQDEKLQKYILQQHQVEAVERVIKRCHDPQKRRGLIWHTQGSGKTYTMIKTAEMLFKAPESDKPTILMLIDRNELEDQLLKNLASLGLENVAHANRIRELVKLFKNDYRGIIVSTIQKFQNMPPGINQRENIYVLIDEAHRSTGGDLGNYLLAGLPDATFIGFTGTPIDKTAHGKGTFKTFGIDDAPKGYLHKYSIRESIDDGTTLPLFYALAPNDMLVPGELMEDEFLSLAETEGISDIEELNKILERAVNLRNFLKGDERVDKVAQTVAEHYRENVEPLGYKAFLVAVDRPACVKYKKALDRYLPPEYSEVVFTGNHNDPPEMKTFHIDSKKEREIRRRFKKFGEIPRILIVTEKLLTGFDAPILYAMYLDKPMRDHTLLQAIARINRPYENEALEMVKPHGFVMDFVGIFDKLERALAFDSDEVNAIVKDIGLLKTLFKEMMEKKAPEYLKLVRHDFDDRDVDILIEYFRDKDRRKTFFKEYKEIEMLYEIISPDAFLRSYLDDYTTLSAIYDVVRKSYSKGVYVDRAFLKKTNELVQRHIGVKYIQPVNEFFEINEETVEYISNTRGGESTKVINLIKNIEKTADEQRNDPFLIALSERAETVKEQFENRQLSTKEALRELIEAIEKNENRKKQQKEKGLNAIEFFVFRTLEDEGILNPDEVLKDLRNAFKTYINWRHSEADLRELRKEVTFTILQKIEDVERVTAIVDRLFRLLLKGIRG